jgi:hypothetical protein
MNVVQEILQSERKPKEKVSLLTEKVKEDKKLFSQLIEILRTGTDVEKGTCADVMKHVSKDNPEIVAPYVDIMIEYINYKAPRVKWGIPESIGNLAQQYPKEVEKAIPKLWVNTKDKSTVVRWCSAFALTEIAKNNPELQEELIPKFKNYVKQEKNNGIKNVYTKALMIISRKD